MARAVRRYPVGAPTGQGAFFAVGHHQVGKQRVVEGLLPIGIQRQDVGVIQPGDGFGLTLEEPRCLSGALAPRVGDALAADDFNGHLLADAGILG